MKKWYYLVKGQKKGPLEGKHIAGLVAAGVISTATPIRAEHTADWMEFRESELAGGEAPCRIINHLGRLDRCYRAVKILFFCNFITLLPVLVKVINVYVDKRDELRESPELFYTLLDFGLKGGVSGNIWLIFVTVGAIAFGALLIFWGMLLYGMWQVVPQENRRLAPVVAAAASIVPFVSVFSVFYTVAGLCSRLAAIERHKGIVGKRPGYCLCMVYCIVGILVFAAPQIFLFFYCFIWIGVTKQLHDASVSILHQRLQEC